MSFLNKTKTISNFVVKKRFELLLFHIPKVMNYKSLLPLHYRTRTYTDMFNIIHIKPSGEHSPHDFLAVRKTVSSLRKYTVLYGRKYCFWMQ